MKYVIMAGDLPLAEYRDEQLTVLDGMQSLVPLFLQRTGNFRRWVEERAIDRTRTNARMLKKAQKMSSLCADFETAMKYNAAMVTDNFWVRREDETLSWEDVRFRDDLYFRMAVSTDDSAFSHEPSRTPELTNIGSREKGWKLEGGRWWLYKRVEYPEHELITYQIGKAMGFDMAHYEMQDGLIRTLDFTGGTKNLQQMDSVMGDNEDYAENYRIIAALLPGAERAYLDILCLDAIMNNPDRHTKNYGFLTSQEDGRLLKLAPNYDNDMALYGSRESWFGYDPHNRMMDEFIDFCEKEQLRYAVPELEPVFVHEVCNVLPEGPAMAEYILKRAQILRENVPVDFTS